MAKKISQLDELTTVTGEESIPVASSGVTKRILLKSLKSIVKKEDVGLGNVDNTSDLNKPVSTATASALNQKAERLHDHEVEDIINFNETVLNIVNNNLPAGTGDVVVGTTEW